MACRPADGPGRLSRRGRRPVAATRPSQPSTVAVVGVTVRAARSAATTGSPSRQVTSCASRGTRNSQLEVSVGAGAEGVLGQRRPVVRHVRLLADDDDLAVEPGLAHRLGGAQPRHAGADDDDARRGAR